MPLLKVEDYRHPGGWVAGVDPRARARFYCQQLEAGRIPYFDTPPFSLPQEDRLFLLSQKQSEFKAHKNISYRPGTDQLRGAAGENPQDAQRLHSIMRNYSAAVTSFLGDLLAPYAGSWHLDFATFRPLEEKGRDLSVHKRNDLVHVDAFPSRPTHGGRILRCFTNINPTVPRIWNTTEGFESLAQHFADAAGLKKIAAQGRSPGRQVLRKLAPVFKAVGVKGLDRSAYDMFMLRFHDYLKESSEYQEKWAKIRLEFPPLATWMVFTDSVPHAALSGQFAMEQTYIVPLAAMVTPEKSPVRVLEAMCGQGLVS